MFLLWRQRGITKRVRTVGGRFVHVASDELPGGDVEFRFALVEGAAGFCYKTIARTRVEPGWAVTSTLRVVTGSHRNTTKTMRGEGSETPPGGGWTGEGLKPSA